MSVVSVESSVLQRYSEGAKVAQDSLCCAVEYDNDLLRILPDEIIKKDYGCGDPSRFVREGDVVLDLGSGSGKICYMAAQLVSENGRVIGVDMNDDMLELARKYQPEMAEKMGGDRVKFLKGYIQDLALDLDASDRYLAESPISNSIDLQKYNAWQSEQRVNSPLIGDNSVDLVVSNCVLNLVSDNDKQQLLKEIFRVTKPGGRVAISDIVSDEIVPAHLKADPMLWSGCVSGALYESDFVQAFVDAGFQAVALEKWESEPWQIVAGIEFRSVTITAIKPESSECVDRGHAVIYLGPYSMIYDDDGHFFVRGERIAVCERTFGLLTDGPYMNDFVGITPAVLGPGSDVCMPPGKRRPASETKGAAHVGKDTGSSCCC